MLPTGSLLPNVRMPDHCQYRNCRVRPALVGFAISSQGDNMTQHPIGLCGLHAEWLVLDWVHDMVEGGPMKSLMLLLP